MGNDLRRGVVPALLAVLAVAAGCGGGVPSSEELQANAATAGARGVIALEGAKIPASGTFAVTVTDADANVDPSAVDAVHVYVISTTSAQEPERVSLVETQPGSGVFTGGVPIALGAEVRGNGTVEVANGDTVTVTYRDQNDGTCNPAIVSATAIVDAYSPDLTVASLDVTGDLRAGGVISVSGTVASDARGGAAGASRVSLSLYAGNNVKDIGTLDVGPLAPGASGSFTKSYTVPASLGGSWIVQARADAWGWVAERLEDNNVREKSVQVIGADLTIGSLDVTGDQRAGGVITVSGTIANDPAAGAAGVSKVRLSLYVGNNVKDIGTLDVGPIAPGASASFTTSYTIPPSLGGTWIVRATADVTGWVAETNEANNELDRAIQITGADLTVGSLAVTGDQRAGGVITVSGTIANDPAGGDAGTSRVYLSLFVGNNIKTIGSLSVAPIAAGGTASFTTDYTIPAGVVGTWYVHADADSTAWVAETNEGNNVLEIPIVVQ